MIRFVNDNAAWLVPVAVAVIGGIFALFKKKPKNNKQIVKDLNNSNINNSNVNINNNINITNKK